MMEHGGLLDERPPSLRAILFAGEPFPIKHLRRLRDAFPNARLLNLYGPTETNVCTFYEVADIPEDRMAPVPIGSACSGDRVWAETEDGSEAEAGEEGELVVDGPTVMLGYWGRGPQKGPYRTGDVVKPIEPSVYDYVGRRDSMVKIRGHRVELGDVEAALLAHPMVREAAAVVVGSGIEARLVGVVTVREDEPPSLLDMKRHCAERLPRYMIIHDLRVMAELPRTGNGKVDRRSIAAALEEALVE
jgi:acyl-coenzyme A synthetase/AMP-(fatty) acid ligase